MSGIRYKKYIQTQSNVKHTKNYHCEYGNS